MIQRAMQYACLFLAITCAASHAYAQRVHRIDIASGRIGLPPANFELLRTGIGELGQWTLVADATAVTGVAIEQFSEDQTENQFSVAAYKPLHLRNLSVRARIKLIKGTIETAGLAFRIQNSDNYYVVAANAFEKRADLFRMLDGKMERIAGADADIFIQRWHTLALIAENEQFTVSPDNKRIFTVSDRTFLTEGRIGLWAEKDNLSRFDQIEIVALDSAKAR
jgi:hypothetical protein